MTSSSRSAGEQRGEKNEKNNENTNTSIRVSLCKQSLDSLFQLESVGQRVPHFVYLCLVQAREYAAELSESSVKVSNMLSSFSLMKHAQTFNYWLLSL